MLVPLLTRRPINPPGIVSFFVLLLSATIMAAPLNQDDASPILGNTEADLYNPEHFHEFRRAATLLQWEGGWWDMPELARDVESTPYLYGTIKEKEQHDVATK